MLRVITQANPFKVEKTIHEYNLGYTIQELFDMEELGVDISSCHIMLNDTTIDKDFDVIKPFVDDTVYIKVLPEGEKFEVSSFGAMAGGLLTIGALALVGATLGPVGLVIAIAGGMIAGGTVASKLYDMANMKPLDKVDQTFAFQGKQNTKDQYGIVPVVYGTSKITPTYAGNDYTTLEDENRNIVLPEDVIDEEGTIDQGVKQYLHQLYVLGYKPTIVEEVFIGDASLLKRVRQSVSVTINSSAKTITASSGTPFSDYITGMRILLEDSNNYGEYTIANVTDTVITVSESVVNETGTITISTLKDSGNYRGVSVEFIYNIDMATNGKVSNLYPYQTTQASLALPCRSGTPQYYTTPDNVDKAILELGFMSGLVRINKENELKDKSVDYKIEYRGIGATTWTIVVNNTITANVREAYRFTKTIHFPTVGQYEIRVTKTSSDSTKSNHMDRLTWNSVTTHAVDASGNYKSPVAEETADDILLMALKIEASEQLKGSVSNLSVVETRWVNDYDVSTDSWILRETHNPCSMYVDVLTNTVLNQNPIEFIDSYFNMDALKSFHAWCAGDNDDSIEYTCNGVLSSETTLEQELQRIVSTGRAEFSVVDGKYTVIQDIPQAAPVQMFTSRNMLKDSFTAVRSFEKIPNKIIIEFVNADIGYKLDERVVEDETATDVIEHSLVLDYIDNADQAYAIGKYMLNSFQIQVYVYTFKASIDSLLVTKGDRIFVQHDSALLGQCSGRVQSIVESGGLITQLLVDETCTMESGKEYGITIRNGSTLETYKVDTLDGDNIVLVLDESVVSGNIDIGDLFSFGEYTKTVEDCIVENISYDSDMNATITAFMYSDDVYTLDTIPVFISNINSVGSSKPKVDTSTYGDVDRTLQDIINRQNTPSFKIFQNQPTAPYTTGDLWLNGVYVYDCIADNDTAFNHSDWRLRSSSTFDVLNKDTFNQPSPEHRWAQIPGNALNYNLLTTKAYEVTSNNTDKGNILIEDNVDWDATELLSAVSVDASNVSLVNAVGNFSIANLVGRYSVNGYMGEAFTNLLVNPNAPASQNVTLVAGQTVIQCYRGTITCSYGTASYGNPLIFTSAGETLSLTMTDCRLGSVTQTNYIPIYVDGSFTANSDILTLTGTTLEIISEFVNISEDATKYYLCSIQGDASNYIDVYIANSQLHIDINTADGSYNENIENITAGEYTISIDWSSGVEILINGAYRKYTEVGSIYGTGDDYYGIGSDVYGFSDAEINFATALDTAYIGVKGTDYFNNVIKEVIY